MCKGKVEGSWEALAHFANPATIHKVDGLGWGLRVSSDRNTEQMEPLGGRDLCSVKLCGANDRLVMDVLNITGLTKISNKV